MKTTIRLISILSLFIFTYCSKSDDGVAVPPEVDIKSSEKQITSLEVLSLRNNLLITIPQAVCDLTTNHGTSIDTDSGVTCK